MDRLMEIQFAAMASEPYHHVLFPGPNTRSARDQAGARTLSDWRSDPSEKVLKVIDSNTSEIISFGKWNVYLHQRSQAEWDQHMEVNWTTDSTLKEGAETYLREIHGMRHRYATGQPHLCKSLPSIPSRTHYITVSLLRQPEEVLIFCLYVSAQYPYHASQASASRRRSHDREMGMR